MLNELFNRLVIFDIETVSEYETLALLLKNNPEKAAQWSKRCVWLRSRYTETSNLSDDELYLNKASLQPEFSKIVCISIAQIKDNGSCITVKSYGGSDEKQLLKNFIKVNAAVLSNIPGSQYCGHNIKRFDVPFIAKRILINQLHLPYNFQIFKMKSWEIPFLDTAEVWSFGAWQESYTSLELLCHSLNVESPKDQVSGADVAGLFYSGQLDRITEYCEKDVVATCQILLRLSGLEINAKVQRR